MKNISKLLNILRKILEMDWDMRNQNKIFNDGENISIFFIKLDFALEKWKYYSNHLKII